MTKLDEIMTEKKLSNNQLVQASHSLGQQLSHKTVQKARLGKRALTPKMQGQVLAALNEVLAGEKAFTVAELFL
ncbi:MAG: hypothetical protein GX801_04755 [Fibrobacter sp.]|nr:hypothetical protein [Fibrobacter sp.]